MQPLKFIALFLFNLTYAYSQAYIRTSIQESDHIYPQENLFFQKVIDARKNKQDIGLIYRSDLRKKYPARFKHEVSEEFTQFFKNTYPNENAKHRIIIVVNTFEIDHSQSFGSKDIGSAKIDFDFFLTNGDTCYLISRFSESIREEAPDVTLTHPNRIKRILLQSATRVKKELEHFDATRSEKVTLFDSLIAKGKPELKLEDEKEETPAYYFFQPGTYYSFSGQVLLFGVTASLALQLKKNPSYLVGANVNLMLYGRSISNSSIDQLSYRVLNYDIGLKVLKQVHRRFFLNFNPQIILGTTEKTATGTTIPGTNTGSSVQKEKLMGFEMDLGAYLIPPQEPGVYSGFNLFYRVCDNSVFSEGFGLKLDLGYRF